MVPINVVKIEVFPANQGDSILISSQGNHILVDAGVPKTYHLHLKKRLKDIASKGEVIDLFIITHIDNDHIGGAIEFFKENGSANDPSIIPVNEVWHNSFRHLQIAKVGQLGDVERDILTGIIAAGARNHHETISMQSKDISISQGSTLAALLLKGQYKWNSTFKGDAISCNEFEQIERNGAKLTLLSPDSRKLKELSIMWEKELRRSKFNFTFTSDDIFDDAFEYLMLMQKKGKESPIVKPISSNSVEDDPFLDMNESCDNSVTNGSSIALILEISGKRILLLGDSHPDIIAESLERLQTESGDNMEFDIVKISHHGSSNNTTSTLIKLLKCQKFILSSDGSKHGHPDRSTLAKIVSHDTNSWKSIYCNYKTDNSEFFRTNAELNAKYKYRIIYPDFENLPIMIEI